MDNLGRKVDKRAIRLQIDRIGVVSGLRKSLQELSVDFIYEWVGVVCLDSTQKIDQIAFRALIDLCRKRATQSFLVKICGLSRGEASNVGESP